MADAFCLWCEQASSPNFLSPISFTSYTTLVKRWGSGIRIFLGTAWKDGSKLAGWASLNGRQPSRNKISRNFRSKTPKKRRLLTPKTMMLQFYYGDRIMDHFYNGAFRSPFGLTITRPSTNTTIVKNLVKKKKNNNNNNNLHFSGARVWSLHTITSLKKIVQLFVVYSRVRISPCK